MTDNEIVKALENEVKSTEYVDSEYCDGVDLTLIKSAVALINCQKAEIDELKHEREILIEDIHHFVDKNNEQLEEIEKLERTISYLEGVCESTPDKVRTEAYKEFAERLKDGAQMADCFDSYNMVVGTHFINNLLKEMIDE